MSQPTGIERWFARHGGKLLLILVAVATVLQAFRFWRAGGWL